MFPVVFYVKFFSKVDVHMPQIMSAKVLRYLLNIWLLLIILRINYFSILCNFYYNLLEFFVVELISLYFNFLGGGLYL